jgi:hypothetical protein
VQIYVFSLKGELYKENNFRKNRRDNKLIEILVNKEGGYWKEIALVGRICNE